MTQWKELIPVRDVFDSFSDTPFETRRDTLVERIKASKWYKNKPEVDALRDYVEELSDTHDGDAFDEMMENIYIIADWDLVFFDPLRPEPEVSDAARGDSDGN